jgi:preprotein translocase subunit SecD
MRGTGKLVASIVVVVVLVLAAVAGFLTSIRPVLGLDLVGGVSVVLAAPANTDRAVMEKALDKIRDRVDALGVAEPDISIVGGNLIQVQLPGLGGQGKVQKKGSQFCVTSPSGGSLGCFATVAEAQAKARAQSVQRVLQIIGTTARLEEREVLPPPGSATQTTVGAAVGPGDPDYKKLTITANPKSNENMVAYEDTNGDGRFTDGVDPKYYMGPVEITGAALSKATAVYVTASQSQTTAQTGWQINFTLNKDGAKKFADITTKLAVQHNLLAILLDRVVQSAPAVQGAITGGSGQITGSFTESQAKNLAVVLNSGSLPVQLQRQNVVTVSPTLGKESLHQGLLAGIVGLIALMLYLAFYYRLLGIVTWLGMAIWGTLAIGLVSLLGRTVGYALSLAGVAGIIVSLGITADSYIVFYERLKDEVRHGKSLRAAVQPAFNRSWRTIYTADIVTILAAVVLYVLAIGSVRGFALTLGLSTALDLVVVYFFKRPVVFLIARSPALTSLRGLGLRSAIAADPVPVMGGER